jgi:hypothetical protein
MKQIRRSCGGYLRELVRLPRFRTISITSGARFHSFLVKGWVTRHCIRIGEITPPRSWECDDAALRVVHRSRSRVKTCVHTRRCAQQFTRVHFRFIRILLCKNEIMFSAGTMLLCCCVLCLWGIQIEETYAERCLRLITITTILILLLLSYRKIDRMKFAALLIFVDLVCNSPNIWCYIFIVRQGPVHIQISCTIWILRGTITFSR